MYYLKCKSENRWVGHSHLSVPSQFASKREMKSLSDSDKTIVENFNTLNDEWFEKSEHIQYPSSVTTQISQAFVFETGQEIKTVLDYLRQKIRAEKILGFKLHNTKRIIASLEKMKMEDFELVEKSLENTYVENTAYAIFLNDGKSVGYKDSSDRSGPIANAQLFASDVEALYKARETGDSDFEIVELQVSLKRRLNHNPDFQHESLVSALTAVEKNSLSSSIMIQNKPSKTHKL